MWTFRCYDDGDTPNIWQRWYVENPGFRGACDSVLGQLCQRESWLNDPHVKKFKGTTKDLFEIRLNGNPKHRFMGFYMPERTFVILLPFIHKMNVYTPKDAVKTSQNRKLEVENDLGKAPVCERPSLP